MDKTATAFLAQSDPILASVIERIGPLKFTPRRAALFPCLVQEITNQQLSRKAADTIFGNFTALFGNGACPSPEQLLTKGVAELRSAGLSRPKAEYIQGLAKKVLDGTLPDLAAIDLLSDREVLERLTAVKGIGRWTAEMVLIFNLGRPDVLPVHDVGVQRGFQMVYGKRKMPTPEFLERFGKRWKPYRTTAALYLWRARDTKA